MDPSQRIITELPLRELFDESGPVPARRARDLAAASIRELLRLGPVRFVVADSGKKPRWVSASDCFQFWKQEVLPHLVEPGQQASHADFPGEYCYLASEWSTAGLSIVLLEK